MPRCLQKDRAQRLHDVADARLEMEEALVSASLSETAAAPHVIVAAGLLPRKRALMLAGATLVIGAAVGAVIL